MDNPQHNGSLTEREREILICVAHGMVVKEIARHLAICEKTVRNHIANLYRKLAVYDRAQLVIYALKQGVVDLQTLP